MNLWLIIAGVLVVAAVVAAAGGFRSVGRRDVVARPARRRTVTRTVAPVEEVEVRRVD